MEEKKKRVWLSSTIRKTSVVGWFRPLVDYVICFHLSWPDAIS
jgi:hypothetical protein